MELSYATIPDVIPVRMISATSTYGIGLWTSIVTYFCNIIGCECKLYNRKIEKAKARCTNELIAKANYAGADGIMQIQYQLSGMTVLMYGIAFQEDVDETIVAQSKAPATYDTWVCANCGTQNQNFTSICKKCGQYK